MSRRRGWIFFAFGLILALTTGTLVFVYLQQQAATADAQYREQALKKYAPPPTLKLPVAARPLDPGVTLSKDDYVIKDFPLDIVPLSAISDTVALENKVVIRSIGQGETFHSSQFLGGEGASVSQQIKQGFVLFAFPIVDLMGQSDIIKDGDHIDLYVTGKVKDLRNEDTEKDLGSATALTLQNIEVFKVLRAVKTEDKTEGAPAALLCSVTPADAALLKYAKDSGGVIDFTLRSPVDTSPFKAPWIDRSEFSQQYLTAK